MDDADSDAARCYSHINKWNKYQYKNINLSPFTTSSLDACAHSASCSPLAGHLVVKKAPSEASRHWPPI